MDYKHSGEDTEAGYKSVEQMKEHVKATMRPEVLGADSPARFHWRRSKRWRSRCFFPEQMDAEQR